MLHGEPQSVSLYLSVVLQAVQDLPVCSRRLSSVLIQMIPRDIWRVIHSFTWETSKTLKDRAVDIYYSPKRSSALIAPFFLTCWLHREMALTGWEADFVVHHIAKLRFFPPRDDIVCNRVANLIFYCWYHARDLGFRFQGREWDNHALNILITNIVKYGSPVYPPVRR